jgi:hypothetical protein
MEKIIDEIFRSGDHEVMFTDNEIKDFTYLLSNKEKIYVKFKEIVSLKDDQLNELVENMADSIINSSLADLGLKSDSYHSRIKKRIKD